jgi:hypothetical protein
LRYEDNEKIELIEESDKLQLVEYIKDSEKFQILDSNSMFNYEEQEGSRRALITINEFIQKYSHIVKILIDNKPSNILASFAKQSQFLPILGIIDGIDKKVTDDFLMTNHVKKVEDKKGEF